MNDILATIIPKSDQLNADDLIGGQTLTIKITNVSIVMGDQPVALSYEGDGGKPYKPGKSMRRVLVNAWGPDTKVYIGRQLTLYRDEKVRFGGVDVGGIRISNMSNITSPITMALTVTKASRKPFTVMPMSVAPMLPPAKPPVIAEPDPILEGIRTRGNETAKQGTAKLQEWWGALDKKYHPPLKADKETWKKIAAEVDVNVTAG